MLFITVNLKMLEYKKLKGVHGIEIIFNYVAIGYMSIFIVFLI